MTREEAKIFLLQVHTDKQLNKSEHEALRIAIKALEQEPKILDTIDFAIDASNGETSYFVGFRNGLRYAKSLVDGEEPQYESCAEQEPKTGHWILKRTFEYLNEYECSM